MNLYRDKGLPKRDPSLTKNMRVLSGNVSGNVSARYFTSVRLIVTFPRVYYNI